MTACLQARVEDEFLSATPNFRLLGVALRILDAVKKIDEQGVALKVGEKRATLSSILCTRLPVYNISLDFALR